MSIEAQGPVMAAAPSFPPSVNAASPLPGNAHLRSSIQASPMQASPMQASPMQAAQAAPGILAMLWKTISDCFASLFSCFGLCARRQPQPVQPQIVQAANPAPAEQVINAQPAAPRALQHIRELGRLDLSPQQLPNHRITDPNKLFAYNRLMEGQNRLTGVQYEKFTLSNQQEISAMPLFAEARPQINPVEGVFQYPPSTPAEFHCVANFGDSSPFGFCNGPLLAQDELQALEHPPIAHLKVELDRNPALNSLRGNEVAFVRAARLGALDTSSPIPRLQNRSLYGNNFSRATHEEIAAHLQRFEEPQMSNIFVVVAPRPGDQLAGQPYQMVHLEALFYRFFTACTMLKQKALPGQRVVVHTGNWGSGAFGNNAKVVALLQIAAARLAGIDEVRYHPLSQRADFNAGLALYNRFEQEGGNLTVQHFLTRLVGLAQDPANNLVYGVGNGT